MTQAEVRDERRQIVLEMDDVQHTANVEIKKLQRKLHTLQNKCPHPPESAGSAQYTRWCSDCGWQEDCS
jgi:hypothetical protein